MLRELLGKWRLMQLLKHSTVSIRSIWSLPTTSFLLLLSHMLFFFFSRDIPRIPDSTHAQLESSECRQICPSCLMPVYCWMIFVLTGSSSFESQKMDRPSISVTSPMSPSMLRDAPQYLSGQLSVSHTQIMWLNYHLEAVTSCRWAWHGVFYGNHICICVI